MLLNEYIAKVKYGEDINTYIDFKQQYNTTTYKILSTFTRRKGKYKPKKEGLSWMHKKKIAEKQKAKNSNYKHGGRKDYKTIAGTLHNEVAHHIDGNHRNNVAENLINIPGYIPDYKNITRLEQWKRPNNYTNKIHEKIHQKNSNSRKKGTHKLPTRDEVIALVEKEYPDYYNKTRVELQRKYELLQVKEKLIVNNQKLKDRIIKTHGWNRR